AAVAGIVLNYRDITAAKDAATALRQSEQRSRSLARTASHAHQALAHRLGLERLLCSISTRLISLAPAAIDDEIRAALGAIGKFCGVQRGYVFAVDGAAGTATNTHEWSAEGVPPHRELLTDVPTSGFRWWMERLQRGETIHVADLAALPADALAVLRSMDLPALPRLRSIVMVPILWQGTLSGMLGFDGLDQAKSWSEDDIALLRMFGEIIAHGLHRKVAQEALEAERALLARRIEERTADLSTANAELARAARMKDEFLASMSHELRTPLHAILGLAESLDEQIAGDLNAKQLQAVQNIRDSGQHLLSLINDILDLSRIGADKLELELADIEIDSVCESVVRMIREPASRKSLRVSFSSDSRVKTVRADARRLKQMPINLLGNAVKFTADGGAIGLEVSGDAAHQRLTFTIWDTGIGIAAADRERVFDSFVQLDSALSRQYPGTGLGLALVKRMAELHGGSVSVDSEPGQGSRFRIQLPWIVAEAQPASSRASFATHYRRALIIEDSPSAAAQLARFLTDQGVSVEVHPQAVGAIEAIRQLRPELILLDILLPDGSGWQILSELKAEAATAAIPTVVVTILDEAPRALEHGAAACLIKPLSRAELYDTLTRLALSGKAHGTARARPPAEAPLILLVDDNQVSIDTVSDYLESKGYRLAIARTGEEALARAEELSPALILMDVQMPGMDGLEATRRLRRHPSLASLPIVAMTALAMASDRQRCLAAGADEYLSKPVSLHSLVELIEKFLARRATAAMAPPFAIGNP
ncbi:MAG TPA: response regulator, partial [Terriglobales bacterium]|nr:response regulator [Terriglobales bacterium]